MVDSLGKMHSEGSGIVSLRVYMCRERVLIASVLYRLDCRDVYIYGLRRCRLTLLTAVDPSEAHSWLKTPHASALRTGARREGEETKVEHVLQVPEHQRIDVGQGMYSLTRLLVKRDISLGSGLARLYSPSCSESLINAHFTQAYIPPYIHLN
jgi:hypothetical protein